MNLVGMLRTLFLSPNLAYPWCIETDPYSGKNQSVARRGGKRMLERYCSCRGAGRDFVERICSDTTCAQSGSCVSASSFPFFSLSAECGFIQSQSVFVVELHC